MRSLLILSLLMSAPVLAETADAPIVLAKRSKTKKQKAEEEAAAKAAEEAARVAAEEEAKRIEAEKAEAAEAAAKAEAERIEKERAEAAARAKAASEKAAAEAEEARGLDARMRRLSDKLARAIKGLPGDHRDQTYAVSAFDEAGEEVTQRRLGVVVGDMLLTNLARDHRFSLTERSQLKAVLDEQALAGLGAVDPEKAAEIGKLVGARALVVGDVSDSGESFIVNARVVDAETAKVLAGETAELPKEELIAFSADAVVLRSKAGALFRSAVAPGWGQVYNREPIKAAVFGGSVAVLALTTIGVTTSAVITHGAYTDFTPSDLPAGTAATPQNIESHVSGLRESAGLQYTTAATLGGITAAAWALTALEAYLSGTDVESLDAALARY
jgi:curli biogenesis system outer membrane secretion channel CsgG